MIPQGYKRSEFGIIPVDWVEAKWGECLATFSSGATPYRGVPAYYKGNIKWISSGELNYNVICDTIEHISEQAVKDTNLKVHQPGTMLIAITGLEAEGTRGRCALVGTPATTNQSCLAINGTDKVCIEYLFEFYKMYGCALAFKYCQGTKQQSFTAEIVKKLPIIYPRAIDEQKAIAKKLSAIDELIAGLSEQIEKKRQLKEGVMQQLLTGKTRLPGFTQPWHEVQIGKIGYTYPGITGKSKDDFNCGDARYITFLNVLNNPVIDTSIFERVNISPTEGQNAVHKGDLFFNTSSETPEEVGICAVLNEEIEDLYLNSFCFGYRLTDDSVLGHYLAYFWRSKRGREIMTSLAQGATRYNLSKAYFNKVNLIIPQTKDEQIAIVDVLNTMDDEICQLEAERDKYTLIKQGMMQELLTGKIRLI